MNNLIQLKGQFEQSSGSSGGGGRSLPAGASVNAEHLEQLLVDLRRVYTFWSSNTLIKGALVCVYYKSVVAKSNRIRGMLAAGSQEPNDSIRGSKFYGEDPIQHVFTHYVKLSTIEATINSLSVVLDIVKDKYSGEITAANVTSINNKKTAFHSGKISKTSFVNYVVDAYYVQRFDIATSDVDESIRSIITLYKTDVPTYDLLRTIGIDVINAKMIDDTTILLSPDEITLLKSKAPYLIAMAVRDLREIAPEDVTPCDTGIVQIPDPGQEPIIGVIDTPFDTRVYFSKWVQYFNMIDEDIEINQRDYEHGTEVSSIIVDGPTINPDLDDGCGRFRVKHFGIAKRGGFSSFTILKAIRMIISQNRDVKVWNLSLGSILPISKNFISPEAAELDRIQSEYDVVFVVAGTNKKGPDLPTVYPIGAPADSLNSLVVNSVRRDHEPASYHRVGPVLSFFHKPDVSYYGGDSGERMHVCSPTGEAFVCGTSFSAPWIARKMAYLICTLGFSREVAKALIIDAAAGWNRQDDVSCAIGYGVVPQRIEKIVKSEDDEIRFILMGTTDAYETYTYRIPVPIANGKQPFLARATLCYFPKCIRNQGVDYTSTEMDIHFGRVGESKGRPKIFSIDSNVQGDPGCISLYEPEARRLYRKWDNVKLISETLNPNSRPRKVYGSGLWGLSIKTKERLREKNGRGLQFGVVVTLKEINGVNRIDEFIKMCMIRGWVVNQIDIENQLDIYAKAEEDIEF